MQEIKWRVVKIVVDCSAGRGSGDVGAVADALDLSKRGFSFKKSAT